MTVNERLFVAGLLPEWDKALLNQDRLKRIELLRRVELADEAPAIIESISRRP